MRRSTDKILTTHTGNLPWADAPDGSEADFEPRLKEAVASIVKWQRETGIDQPFDAVQGAVAMTLRQQAYYTALRQYLALLAGQAELEGVELDAADTPLVQ